MNKGTMMLPAESPAANLGEEFMGKDFKTNMCSMVHFL